MILIGTVYGVKKCYIQIPNNQASISACSSEYQRKYTYRYFLY